MEDYRPPSEQLVDIHVFVVPPELWLENLRSAFNKIVADVISAGFIRVHPEMTLPSIRQEVERQLGNEILPREYIFCRSVGRRFTQVKQRQEKGLKVKYFLPPHAYCPELFVLDSDIALRSQASSDGTVSQISLGSQGRQRLPPNPDRSMKTPVAFELGNDSGYIDDDDLERVKKDVDFDDGKKESTFELEERRRREEEAKRHQEELEAARRLKEAEEAELARRRKAEEEEALHRKEIAALQSRIQDSSLHLKSSKWSTNDFRRRKEEIDSLTDEIERRKQELERLENEHQARIRQWESEESHRRSLEANRRREFEELERQRRQMEEELARKQREELAKLQARLYELRKEWEKEEKRLSEEDAKRREEEEIRRRELEEARNAMEAEKARFETDPDFEAKLAQLQTEIEAEERKRKAAEEDMKSKRVAAQQEYQMLMNKYEEDKANWEKERQRREEERQQRYAEEMRLREADEQRQKEHEERMQAERERMEEERQRFVEDQKKWQEERERLEAEEKQREQETEEAIKKLQADKPQVPELDLNGLPGESPRNLKLEPSVVATVVADDEGHRRTSSFSTKENADDSDCSESILSLRQERDDEEEIEQESPRMELTRKLEELRQKRVEVERRREDMIKKARQLQIKTQNRRNQARDWWKKKYFEEKKRTPGLEEQVNKYRSELESIHRKIVGSMESSLREKRLLRSNNIAPSEQANRRIQATRLQHEIDELQRRVDDAKMRLTAEIKLRTQAESELRTLKSELTQKKINLTLTRSQQLAAMGSHDLYSPRTPMISHRA